MHELATQPLSLGLDGALAAGLREALQDPAQFQQFLADPQAYAARHALPIDASFASVLKERLGGLGSYEAAQKLEYAPGPRLATASNSSSNNFPGA